MRRVVEPELLDGLPANDPGAIRSRHDLQTLNRWMRHPQIMTQALRSTLDSKPVGSILEIGAGDGTFLLKVAQRLNKGKSGTTVFLADKQPVVTPETCRAFEQLDWRAEIVR